MRVTVTGATGFIGNVLVRALVARGDDVVAIVRAPSKAASLRALGVTLVGGDITEPHTLRPAMRAADAVFHLAAWYQLGVTDRSKMYQINVRGTENVLTAAADEHVPRIVHCSSVAVLGGSETVSDENTVHPGAFATAYEETKWEAHRRAQAFANRGVIIVLPGVVYGPGDPSLAGMLLRYYAKGWLLVCPFQSRGFCWVHVNDVADGMIAALEKGKPGKSYILGGENLSLKELFETLEPVTGIRPPRREIHERVMRLTAPFSPLIARGFHAGPRIISDAIATMHDSHMASSAKAERELGYVYRNVVDAMPEVIDELRES